MKTNQITLNRISILIALSAILFFSFTSNAQLYVNTSNKVGIGITSPAYILDILQTQNAASRANITNSYYGTASQVLFQAINDQSNSLQLGITSSGYTPSGLVNANMGFVQTNSGSLLLRTFGTNDMILATNNANAMIIKSNGYIGIGTTGPSNLLDVQGVSTAYTINTNGKVQGVSANWTSDQMFKTNVDTLHNALAIIRQLKPKSYYFDTLNFNGKGKFCFPPEKQYGFIANDIQTILPELVSFSIKPAILDSLKNVIKPAYTYRSLNYNAFISILTKGIQELQQKNDSLQTKTNKQDSINMAAKIKAANQDSINASLQNQINQLLTTINSCCTIHTIKSMQLNSDSQTLAKQTDVELSPDKIGIVLDQNVPNPFAEQTTINYFLPDNITRAQIIFLDQSGKLIKAVDLTEKGKGQLNVFANDLTNGIYTYSLIVDGQTMETKKMVKAK